VSRVGFVVGLLFGAILVLARVHEYNVIHDMLLLRDPYVFLLMGSAVATAMPILYFLRRSGWVTPFGGQLAPARHPVRRKDVLGSAVFGTGWAVTGSCPGPALAMAAGGAILALPVMAGFAAGVALRDATASQESSTASTAPSAGGAAPASA
jgi:uncharacterized membrane protein YedE/YeeE